jgi:hypothetical protein
MAQQALKWTPAGGVNSTGQQIEYRKKGTTSWIVFSSLPPTTSTATVTGLLDNTIYEFRVINMCAVGGNIPSGVFETIIFTCITVTATHTYDSITVNFSPLGADIVKYDVILVETNAIYTVENPSGNVSYTFSGLTPATPYSIKVILYTNSFVKTNCPVQVVNTDQLPECNAPSGVTAEIQ